MEKLSFLYIGNFNTLSVGEPEIAKSLETLGHSVERISEKDTPAFDVLQKLKQGRYSVLLFAKFRVGGIEERMEIIRMAKERSTKVICWGFDLYFGL